MWDHGFDCRPIPDGANFVIIQEDVEAFGDLIRVKEQFDKKSHIRMEGSDFSIGHTVKAPLILGAKDISLIAAMNLSESAALVPTAFKAGIILL